MNAPKEIEAKFRIDNPQLLTELLGLGALGLWIFQPAAAVDQINRYYDTATRQLQQAAYGFRIREAKGRYTATLKGPGQLSGAIHTRTEWEQPLTDHAPSSIPAGELLHELQALIGHAPLLPLLTIYTQRQIIHVLLEQQPIVELALDQSRIEAGGRTSQFLELELELLPNGTLSQLEQLISQLRQRFPLTPEPRSKLQRGIQLLNNT